MAKQLTVNPYNKKDIERICEELLRKEQEKRTVFDPSIPDADDFLEMDGGEHALTDEIYKFIEQSVQRGYLRLDDAYSFVGSVRFYEGKIQSACFGCLYGHDIEGKHLEIQIAEGKYIANLREL